MNEITQVNRSGFPLQIAVAHHVREMNPQWNVLYEEHAWRRDLNSGFIDLVLEDVNHTWLMNVECKRVRETSWIFLTDARSSPSPQAQVWITSKRQDNRPIHFDWVDVPMHPECPQSSFCVVPGQDQKARPMLERVAADVVASTEALAEEELTSIPFSYSNLRIYQNVIITTAELKVCEIEASKIGLATGEIDSSSKVKSVPYVRFRKQLGAAATGNLDDFGGDTSRMVRARESTVFVVNAQNLSQFLANSDLPESLGRFVRVVS